jgi:hypothetical protein
LEAETLQRIKLMLVAGISGLAQMMPAGKPLMAVATMLLNVMFR